MSSTSKSHTNHMWQSRDSNPDLYDPGAWASTPLIPASAILKYYRFSLVLCQNFFKVWDPVLFIFVLPALRNTTWHFLGVLWN